MAPSNEMHLNLVMATLDMHTANIEKMERDAVQFQKIMEIDLTAITNIA